MKPDSRRHKSLLIGKYQLSSSENFEATPHVTPSRFHTDKHEYQDMHCVPVASVAYCLQSHKVNLNTSDICIMLCMLYYSCIGINYTGQQGALNGCHNDVEAMQEF